MGRTPRYLKSAARSERRAIKPRQRGSHFSPYPYNRRLLYEALESRTMLSASVALAKLSASNGTGNDAFGGKIACNGDTLVIGAAETAVGGNVAQGVAYVFTKTGAAWTQAAELVESAGATDDGFGSSVAISGNTIVVGAQGATIGGNASQGAAYVFTEPATGWTSATPLTPTVKLTESSGAAYDYFGESVSVSGNTVVVGAPFTVNSGEGAAYVFAEPVSGWASATPLTPTAELTELHGAAFDVFGFSVSISGDSIAVGSLGATIDGNNGGGAVYIFTEPVSGWTSMTPTATLTASDGAAGDSLGESIAISGNTLVAGAAYAAVDGNYQGAAYVFTEPVGGWTSGTQTAELTASDASVGASDGSECDFFGASVAISGDTIVVGAVYAPYDVTTNSAGPGAAYVFAEPASGWVDMTQTTELTASDGVARDFFGNAVSINDNDVIVGAPRAKIGGNAVQGAAYVYAIPALGATSLVEGPAAGSASDMVTFPGSWTASSNAPWLHTSSSGSGNGLALFTFDANSGATRTGTLTIDGQTLTVTQAGSSFVSASALTTLVPSELTNPTSVAVDGAGNVYIADRGDNAIKECNATTQMLTTLVSTGLTSPQGIAVDAAGNVYIADTGDHALKEWDAATQTLSTLVSAGLADPSGVAVDGAGNVYIADAGGAVDVWNPATQTFSPLFPDADVNEPEGVAVDAAGNVYITDAQGSGIQEWNVATQTLSTVISGSGVNQSNGVAVDGSGNIYAATGGGAIKEWDVATQTFSTLFFPSGSNFAQGLAVDGAGNVYIANYGINLIQEVPRAFVSGAAISEMSPAGSDSLPPVLPSSESLSGVFAPSSNQSWLSVGSVAAGIVNFVFTQNAGSTRTADITVLGQPILVTQNGAAPLTVTAADWTSAGLTLTLGSDGNLHVYTTGTTTDAVPPVAPASVSNIEITSPSDTTANLTIDSTNGDPVPAGGLNYSGGGGLIITGSGSVTLSGTNSYTGGTTVSAGTLLVNAASALPDGGSLTVDAGGTFIFDPSQSASSVSAAGFTAAAPSVAAASETSLPILAASTAASASVTASTHSTLAPFLERQVENLSYGPGIPATLGRTSEMPTTMSRATIDAVFTSHRSAFDQTISPVDIARSAHPWAWLAANESPWNSSDQNKMTVEALDKVLARFGV